MKTLKYTPAVIADMMAKYNRTHTPTEVAALYGTTNRNIRSAVSRLRGLGYDFACGVPDGTVKSWVNATGQVTTWEKVEGKWTYIKGTSVSPEKPPRKAAKSTEVRKHTTPPAITPPSKPEGAKLTGRSPTKHTRSKNPVVNGGNPGKIKVADDAWKLANGWHWVTEKRGWQTVRVLKSPDKLNAA